MKTQHAHARAGITPTIALSTLLAAASFAQDWAGKGRLNGVVTDESAQPIAGATVQLRSPRDPNAGPPDLKTDKKGRWSYLGLVGGNWTVRIAAEASFQ